MPKSTRTYITRYRNRNIYYDTELDRFVVNMSGYDPVYTQTLSAAKAGIAQNLAEADKAEKLKSLKKTLFVGISIRDSVFGYTHTKEYLQDPKTEELFTSGHSGELRVVSGEFWPNSFLVPCRVRKDLREAKRTVKKIDEAGIAFTGVLRGKERQLYDNHEKVLEILARTAEELKELLGDGE